MIRNECLTSSELRKNVITSENVHLKMGLQQQQDIISPNAKTLMKAQCENLRTALKRN